MMTLPLCSAAAVLSLRMADPTNTPCAHEFASYTSGTPWGRRPPNSIAEIGTPSESSQAGSMIGHWPAGAQNRELG
uniref:Putative secreted protein n=1 Tax=Anopheles darlingi TaxID=43151 RepID=A0A2M4DBM6_ANODA